MRQRLEVDSLTRDEQRQLIQEAVRSEIQGHTQMAALQLASEIGRVDRAMLARIYDTSVPTITRWAKEHGFEEVEGPHGQRVYYRLEDVREKVEG